MPDRAPYCGGVLWTRRVLRLPALLGALVAATLGVVLVASPALACKCRPASIKTYAKKADVVFSGTVTDVRRLTLRIDKRDRDVREYTVEVDRRYQGKPVDTTVVVVSSASPAACGLGPIERGEEWIFFVTGAGTTSAPYSATSCGGSAAASTEYLHRVEKALGAGSVVADPTPPTPPLSYQDVDTGPAQPLGRMVAPGAALALVGLLGLVLFGRRSVVRG